VPSAAIAFCPQVAATQPAARLNAIAAIALMFIRLSIIVVFSNNSTGQLFSLGSFIPFLNQ